MLEVVARENFKRSTPGKAGILASVIARAKMVVVPESREIAQVAYLGQIMNIGSGRTRKL